MTKELIWNHQKYREIEGRHVRIDRNILEIEALRWKYALKQKLLFNTEWKVLWSKLRKIELFWADSKKYGRSIYEISGDGIHVDHWVKPDQLNWYFTIPVEDLPLLLYEKTLPEGARASIMRRLKGGQKRMPQNQALGNEYEKHQERFKRIGAIVWTCENIMKRYVDRNYSHLWKTYDQRLVTLIFNNRTYVYGMASRCTFQLTQTPEEEAIRDTVPSKALEEFL